MNQRSPSRTRSYSPSCPEDPDENNETRRTISRIQKEVERELENADRILSGSRANSRTESMRIRSESVRKDVNADSGESNGYRSSVTPTAGSTDRGARNEECSRMSATGQAEVLLGNREAGYDANDRAYEEQGGPHGQYSFPESTGAPGSPGRGRQGDPYDGSGRAENGYGGRGGPGDPYDGSGRAGKGYGGTEGSGRPGDPYDGSDRAENGYGGTGGPGDPYDGSGRAGNGYGGIGGPGDPYDGSGRAGNGYGGTGGPGDPYDGSGRAGSGYEGTAETGAPGRPGDPYDGSGRAGNGYGGTGGPGDPYDGSGRAESGRGGPGRPGDPYDGSGRAESGRGGPGRPGDPYDGSGRAGNGRGGPGRPGDPYDGSGRAGNGHGGPGRPGDPYDGSGRAGSGYEGTAETGATGRPGDPYDGSGRAGNGYGGTGGPGDPYDGSGRAGNGYGGTGAPGDPYDGSGRAGNGYGGIGGPGVPYDGSGRAGSGHGGPGRPGDPYDGSGRAGSGYGRLGGSGNPYGATSQGGVIHSPLEAYLQDGDPYAAPKGTPASAITTRDPFKTGYDPGRGASGIPFRAASTRAYDSRGKSPPSVHYSPSTATRLGSPSRMQPSKPVSETRSNFAGGRSQMETQYSASRAQSRVDFNSSSPSGYERGASPTSTLNPNSKNISDIMGAVIDIVGFERSGNHPSPGSGSRGSPVRSTRGGSPINESKRTFGTGTNDQSLTNKICPAALHGKCLAYVRDSNVTEQSRATSASLSSASKRPLSRIEEGPSREEMANNEVQGQDSCFQGEDFRHPAGGTCSQIQLAKEVFIPCPPRVPPRPRCESPGQPMFASMINDQFQNIAPRSQAISFGQPPTQSRVSASSHDYHNHHDHHDHDMEGFHGKPAHLRDDKTISALNHLSQLQKTPSYYRCKFDRGLDFSSCEKTTKETPKMIKFPEKPCKVMEELQEMISCEAQDVDSAWYLTSDEKKTYKKPCPKQQKAQENVKSIVKAQNSQSCAKEYAPLEHPDPDDITPELAASMMFSQEKGVKLNECPDETIKRFFPDIPRPPFPVKLSAVHIVDSNQEDQEEMIEKSASVPSEGVSDSAYTRTMQNKGDMGAQKSYDIDFAVGAEKREYVLVAEKPQRYNKVQFRGNLPSWFPGYLQAFPENKNGMQLVASPSRLFQKAWTNTNPENIPSSDVVVLE